MAGENIVFFPKYTALVTGTYYSDPYEVTGYKTLSAEVNNSAVINSATVTGRVQQSSDLLTWTDTGSDMIPSAGASATQDTSNPARYVRLKVVIGGTNATATIWAKAVARDA